MIEIIKKSISKHGYIHLSGIKINDLEKAVASLGEVIQTTDVKATENSKSLVTAYRALDFHTDHHKADIIAWYCFEQSSEGGETMLLDTSGIFSDFSDEEKVTLSSIFLREHKVFDDDKESHPLVIKINEQIKCYYSFWLVEKNMPEKKNAVLRKFQDAVTKSEHRSILLRPGDALLIDNGRMLHGRGEIKGDKKRHLKRYWVSVENLV